MKRTSNPLLRSKTALYFLCVAAGISVFAPACKKDDKESSAPAVSQAEVAAAVNTAVTNGGVVAQTEQAAQTASMYIATRKAAKVTTDDCGYSDNGEIKFATEPNTVPYLSINYTYDFQLKCDANKNFQAFHFDFGGKTVYTDKKMSVADTSTANFDITGLSDDSKPWVFNQTFKNRAGLVSKDASTQSFYSVIDYTAADVTVSKSTLQIVSGTAKLKISGTNAAGKSFSYEGQIVYKGNKKAVFTVTGGSSFDLTWN
ncbi:hypothetical protein [Chitinophaga sancti]|uniref:Lipoprotein n=1 Tax=Chitinophaga sancti TaxID=1004 RepID=A0A1K1RPN6_9BACT|nr:hypothetical protein [Chitinophaga sancti]WQD62508.1 hypothetical protein U0033_31950 [Chitinophaga sancti]WQG91923.1 hypothetical protein SR876_10435 [Chitinophaga sancti]SFW74235.1 hypothetical protein SAMN05661012_04124 [Chitinophaga sancti]